MTADSSSADVPVEDRVPGSPGAISSGDEQPLTVGLCGPPWWAREFRESAKATEFVAWRYLDVVSDDPEGVRAALPQISGQVDALVFHGRAYHDRAVADHVLDVPAVYLSVEPAALLPALLTVTLDGTHDIERISVDSLSADQIKDVYATFRRSAQQVRSIQYSGPDEGERYTNFHRQLFESGKTTGAVTTVTAVEHALRQEGVPVARMTTTQAQRRESLRRALGTVAALANGARAEMSQIVVVAVSLSNSARPAGAREAGYWQQELSLELHKIILAEARLMDGTVATRKSGDFAITSTLRDLRRVTHGLRDAPILARARQLLGVGVDVGIGLGLTAREADKNALIGVERARMVESSSAIVVSPEGGGLSLPAKFRAGDRKLHEERNLAFLKCLLDASGETGSHQQAPFVVDVAEAARLADVPARSARRYLESLVDDGLAWPMQAIQQSGRGGRPRLLYRLVHEKLQQSEA
jgi:hypothetical protein